ncbi:serine/threonine protein kinase [Candidatus Uabimicrobium sp. HlEnr_7]|uniref:serine/threonine protein kinase n=1 Tax=Candidatus Uabimicrobium helgolandensis TaxID=3095367 RepID=UPI003559303E
MDNKTLCDLDNDNGKDSISHEQTIIDEKDTAENPTVISLSTNNSAKKPASILQQGEMFGHYRIESLLGRGGMGVVYKAFDTKLQRFVALKLILSQNLSEVQLQRFVQEAQATAKLEHSSIVKLFSSGETPQYHLVMEYIDGDTLSRRYSMSYQLVARLGSEIASALHFAHEKDIIHRDIKPSNIMLTSDNEPKIMDFGLAKMLDVQQSLSSPGSILGTLAYMPAEQAEGRTVDRRSDVYSLGATIYELLCKRPPFDGESHINVLHQIFHSEIISPSQLNPDIPRELEAICLKCLERNPQKRYQDAALLATDLQNYLHHRPISATPPNAFTNAKKFILRNKVLVLSLAAVFFIISASGIFSYIQWKNSEQQRQYAEKQSKNAQRAKQKADSERKNANLHLAKIAQAKALELKNTATTTKNSVLWGDIAALAGAGLEFTVDQKMRDPKLQKELKNLIHESIINYGLIWEKKLSSLHFNVYKEEVIIFSEDGTIKYNNLYTNSNVSTHNIGKFNKEAHFSPITGNYIAIARQKEIVIWDCMAKKIHRQFSYNFAMSEIVVSEEGKFVAAHNNNTIQIWQSSGEHVHSFSIREKKRKYKGKKVFKSFCDSLTLSFLNEDTLRVNYSEHCKDFSLINKDFTGKKFTSGRNSNKQYFYSSDLLATLSKNGKLMVHFFKDKSYLELAQIPSQIDSDKAQIILHDKTLVIYDAKNIYIWKITEKERLPINMQMQQQQTTYSPMMQQQRISRNKQIVSSKENSDLKLQFHQKLSLSAVSVSINNDFLLTYCEGKLQLWSLGKNWSDKSQKYVSSINHTKSQDSKQYSKFSYRTDLIHGQRIEELLESRPRKTTAEIFQRKVSDTLTTSKEKVVVEWLK